MWQYAVHIVSLIPGVHLLTSLGGLTSQTVDLSELYVATLLTHCTCTYTVHVYVADLSFPSCFRLKYWKYVGHQDKLKATVCIRMYSYLHVYIVDVCSSCIKLTMHSLRPPVHDPPIHRIGCTVAHSTRFTSGRVTKTSVSSERRRLTLVPSTP